MATALMVSPAFRELCDQEVSSVAGAGEWIDENGNGVFDGGDTILVTARKVSDSGTSGGDWSYGWAGGAVAVAGGTWLGLEMGGVATTGVIMAVEYGVIGAEAGALAGPIGVVVGVAVGALAGYVIYEYGPEMLRTLDEAMGTTQHTMRQVQQ